MCAKSFCVGTPMFADLSTNGFDFANFDFILVLLCYVLSFYLTCLRNTLAAKSQSQLHDSSKFEIFVDLFFAKPFQHFLIFVS